VPFEITYDQLPVGQVVEAAPKGATSAKVRSTCFLSTEDGQECIRGLEGFPTELLNKLPADRRIAPASVELLLAVIRRDRTGTLYVNERSLIAGIMIGRSIQKGEHIFNNDIVDIATMELEGVTVPEDAGVVLVFSVGWRKGLYYDFSPLHPSKDLRRTAPFSAIFGQCYSHVLFQERFCILDPEWDALLKSKWFPFAALKNETLDEMISHLRAGWDINDLTEKIAAEVRERVPHFVEGWRKHPAFADHLRTLEKAAEHFTNGDWLSAAAMIYPRIEGLLRSNHGLQNGVSQITQRTLSATAVQARSGRPASLLLPHKFEQYLRDVYFASFQPGDKQVGVSRNSVGHGVASEDGFNEKAATIGLLVTQQLLYCFERPDASDSTAAVTVLPTPPCEPSEEA
jgi:hypothetical protein